jgi:hypothetical protein
MIIGYSVGIPEDAMVIWDKASGSFGHFDTHACQLSPSLD